MMLIFSSRFALIISFALNEMDGGWWIAAMAMVAGLNTEIVAWITQSAMWMIS